MAFPPSPLWIRKILLIFATRDQKYRVSSRYIRKIRRRRKREREREYCCRHRCCWYRARLKPGKASRSKQWRRINDTYRCLQRYRVICPVNRRDFYRNVVVSSWELPTKFAPRRLKLTRVTLKALDILIYLYHSSFFQHICLCLTCIFKYNVIFLLRSRNITSRAHTHKINHIFRKIFT